METIGIAPYLYRIEADWAKLPEGWLFKDVATVACDAKDRVYVFNRGEHPMIVFDREGNVLDAWGEDIFTTPHGLHIAPDGYLYCTDQGDNTVRKCTPDGKVVLQFGQMAPRLSGNPFNQCTHTALAPNQDIYVTDGYGNARVHRYTPDGKHINSWGDFGSDPGQFNLPHNVICDPDGWVYVADRENHRIQIFDGNGKYESQWNNLHRPCGLWLTSGAESVFYVSELPPWGQLSTDYPNLGPRISILSKNGKLVGRVDKRSGLPHGQFSAPHGVAADSHGDVYVAEVAWTVWSNHTHPGEPIPRGLRSLQKLVRQR